MAPQLDTLAQYVSDLADLGDRAAVVDRGQYRTRVFSYREIIGKAFALRQILQQRVAPGDRVLLWGPSGAAWAIAYYAALLAGAVLVPLDAAFSAEYARRILHRTEARVALADAARAASFSGLAGVASIALEKLLELPVAAKPQMVVAAAPESLLEIVYTSGATADPKGVMITHGNILANLRPIAAEVAKYEKWARPLLPLRFIHLIPLSHLFGQVMGLLIPPLLSSSVVYLEQQSAGAVAGAIREHRASVVVAVPRQVEMLGAWALAQMPANRPHTAGEIIAEGKGHGALWRWWRWRRLHRRLGLRMWALVVGGAALPAAEEELWRALGFAVVQGYGLTETAPAVAITHPFKMRRGAVGRKLAGMEIRIAPDGEILVRGANVSPGYYHDAAATAAAFEDGWLRTGDLGQLDAEGNLHYLGRKKEVIVTPEGLNVYPTDVEAALDAEPEIDESAAVADPATGRVRAVLAAAPGAASALPQAVARANERLEPHQRVAAFSLWPEAALPRTASTHKLQRVKIRRWVEQTETGAGGASPAAAGAAAVAAPIAEDWRDFLAQLLAVSRDRFRPEARLTEDLGLGSLDRVQLLNWLETHLGVEMEESELAAVRTAGDLDQLLARLGAPEAAPPGAGGATAARPASGSAGAVSRPRAYRYPRWPSAGVIRRLRSALRAAIIFPALRTTVRVRATGRENLRGLRRPVLFIANHQSLLDVPVILRALPRRWKPWLAPAMALDAFRAYFQPTAPRRARARARRRYHLLEFFFNIFVLAEATGIQPALRRAGELTDEGYCPLIFPEGARTPDGRLHRFRPGIGVFAQALRAPVVPVLIGGLYEILPVGAEHARRGVARVEFGPPIALPPGDDPAAVTAALEAWFARRLGPPAP